MLVVKGQKTFIFSIEIILKICLDGEEELVDKDALEGCDIVLFVKHQHRLFIVDGINRAE